MKKILFTTIMIGLCSLLFSQKTAINKEFLKKEVVEKVHKMQSIIKFDNAKVNKLVKIEYQYSLQIEKIEKCKSCNKGLKVEKLKHKKNKAIMKLLPRDEYLKYNSIENHLIKKHPVRV